MAKRASNNKPETQDVAPAAAPQQAATAAAQGPTESAKDPAAVHLGRLGGLKGGPARARKLTKQQRSQIARNAALARWAKRRSR